VDEHGQPKPRARVPDRIERGVVEAEPAAVGLRDREAKTLRDLSDADRACRDVFRLFNQRYGR
jgi:hypothetical protein